VGGGGGSVVVGGGGGSVVVVVGSAVTMGSAASSAATGTVVDDDATDVWSCTARSPVTPTPTIRTAKKTATRRGTGSERTVWRIRSGVRPADFGGPSA
jgi:hypothetical protein